MRERRAAMAAAPSEVDTFKKIFEFTYEGVPVLLYRCSDTGLRLAAAQVQSPTVHGYFVVQTEAFDDYGSPHTLEHLIFLGSERYPYKGVLDVLANRCLAQGTNAWTDTDHTGYTVDTAGSEGFLQIMPVFLDHVLFPTLKDSGFVTEVHHVTGEGSNAGVVYCEMQARENEASDLVDRAMKLAAYPGKCSYKSETGGRLEELRKLTSDMVRDYHGAYYRPENLCVIITGQASCKDLCTAMRPVVEAIKQSKRIKALPAFAKPFTMPVPKPEAPVNVRLEFPAEDEKTGAICYFAWHGPRWDDLVTITALHIFLCYLTQDSIAPLRKAFVETEPPLCGKIGKSMLEQSVYLFNISLKSVDVEQLSKRDVGAELTNVIAGLAANKGAAIDLKRMQSLIRQKRRQHLSSVEESPHSLFSGEIIGAFLYAPDFGPKTAEAGPEPGSFLRRRLDEPALLEALLGWSAEQWAKLCEAWMLGPSSSPRVQVIGTPSKACGQKVQAEEAARISAQKELLGEAGCKAAGEVVSKAEEENEVGTPDEVIQSVVLPSVSKIRLIPVSTVRLTAAGAFEEVYGQDTSIVRGALLDASSSGLPALSMQFDHIAGAQFAQCHVMLPLGNLSAKQLELLPLWCDVAFELPVAASGNGPAMDYEAVVQALTDVSVHKGFNVGVGGGRFSVGSAANMLHAEIKVERAQYAEAPLWLARLLADVVFDVERLRIAAKRMLNDVPNSKRSGQALVALAMRAMNYRDDCTEGAFSVFRVERILNALLETEGALVKAAQELSDIRTALIAGPIFARVACDVGHLGGGNAFVPWLRAPFQATTGAVARCLEVKTALAREHFAPEAVQSREGGAAARGCLLSSSAEESNYWSVQSACLTEPRSPELAPLLVAIEYVTALEGPFWRKIRGKGLSYHYSLSHSLEKGTIQFGLFKATDPVAAFRQAGLIVERLCAEPERDAAAGEKEKQVTEALDEKDDDGEGEEDDKEECGLDPRSLEAAQSGVLFQLIEPVDTVPSAMDEAFANTLARLPADQLQWLLKEVQNATAASVSAALKTHVLPLFDGSRGRTVSMICPAQKLEQVKADMRTLSPPFHLKHYDVDELAKALGPGDGFAKLRAAVLAVTGA